MSKTHFIKIRCLRMNTDRLVNTRSIHSISSERWPNTAAVSKIEYTGDADYHTATAWVSQSLDEILIEIRKEESL